MKRFIKYIIKIFEAIVLGIPLTIWILLRDRQTVYYIPRYGMGDYCIALGYLEAFKKKNRIDHVTVILTSRWVQVTQFYPYWDELLILSKPLYLSLVYFGSLPYGRMIHQKIKRIKNITYGFPMRRRQIYADPSIHVDDVVKDFLDLQSNEQRMKPKVQEVDIHGIIKKYDLPKGKSVLLNPFTSGDAVAEIDVDFYIRLAKKLKEKGFTVVTSLGAKDQKPLPGTRGVYTTLTEAWHLVRWCGYVIGTRSGFFDFICQSGCSMIAIYEPSYKLRSFIPLKLKNNGENIKEFVWKKENDDKLIENILALCIEWEERERT